MSDGGLMALVNGYVMNREAVVSSLNEAPGWDAYEIMEPRLVRVSDVAAALVYRAVARRGDEEPFEAVMSSIYTLTDGRPRLVLYQQTTTTH
ncbi:MAG: DUF4440 domain-containing protein [Arachnia propionica]|uniref:DUF4440 domain-containing protein n=1 Tax=Arachnia propionica TaxID=1750 RepID=UPI002704604E|nr:DUF4440 domain-containing protein [Arachnia propionica]